VAPGQEDIMLFAVAQDLVGRAQLLKLAQDESNHMLNLSVWVFQDTFIREAHQAGGQTLHILPSLYFT
jgi:hypothetical protein